MFLSIAAIILPAVMVVIGIWLVILSVVLFTQRIFIKTIIREDPAEMRFSGLFHGVANAVLIALSLAMAMSLIVSALVVYPLIYLYFSGGPSRWMEDARSRTEQKQTIVVDAAMIVVEEGDKFAGITADDPRYTKEFIISKLGPPMQDEGRRLDYRAQHGVDFFMSRDMETIREIRLNRGFRGKLDSNISLSSTMEDVFSVYGHPDSERVVDEFHGHYGNRTLYRKENNSKIFYNEKGLLFWFWGDRINQIVAFNGAQFVAQSNLTAEK